MLLLLKGLVYTEPLCGGSITYIYIVNLYCVYRSHPDGVKGLLERLLQTLCREAIQVYLDLSIQTTSSRSSVAQVQVRY